MKSAPDLKVRVWFLNESHANGASAKPVVRLRKDGASNFNFSKFPYVWEIALRKVSGSAAVDSWGLAGERFVDGGDVPVPWPADGADGSIPADESTICAKASPRTGSLITRLGRFYDPHTMATVGRDVPDISTGSCQGSYLSFTVGQQGYLAATGVPLVTVNLGGAESGNFLAMGLRARGFLPPSLDEVRDAVPADAAPCVNAVYQSRVDQWYADPQLPRITVSYVGWAKELDSVPATLPEGRWVWSDEIGNYATTLPDGSPTASASSFDPLAYIEGQGSMGSGREVFALYDGII